MPLEGNVYTLDEAAEHLRLTNRGQLEWRVTKAGKVELKRHETFRDWKKE